GLQRRWRSLHIAVPQPAERGRGGLLRGGGAAGAPAPPRPAGGLSRPQARERAGLP
ncbi:unnamed protein product, partial [Heterosigma akashiwo]